MAMITLLTDFGYRDAYVGVMKGVILSRRPDCPLVDLSHGVPPQDIRFGAYLLEVSVPHFPAGTVHLAVVDPGVGTSRKAIIMRTRDQYLVGPDNGLLTWAAGLDVQVWQAEKPEFWRPNPCTTFHGRDVFAPLAAELAAGVPPSEMGQPIDTFVRLPRPAVTAEGPRLSTEVMVVDGFGNLITGLHAREERPVRLVHVSRHAAPVCDTFASVPPGHLVAYWGSGGYLEVGVNQGSAAEVLSMGAGARVELELHS